MSGFAWPGSFPVVQVAFLNQFFQFFLTFAFRVREDIFRDAFSVVVIADDGTAFPAAVLSFDQGS